MASDALCFSGLWNSKYDPQAVLEDLKAGVQRAEEQRAAGQEQVHKAIAEADVRQR